MCTLSSSALSWIDENPLLFLSHHPELCQGHTPQEFLAQIVEGLGTPISHHVKDLPSGQFDTTWVENQTTWQTQAALSNLADTMAQIASKKIQKTTGVTIKTSDILANAHRVLNLPEATTGPAFTVYRSDKISKPDDLLSSTTGPSSIMHTNDKISKPDNLLSPTRHKSKASSQSKKSTTIDPTVVLHQSITTTTPAKMKKHTLASAPPTPVALTLEEIEIQEARELHARLMKVDLKRVEFGTHKPLPYTDHLRRLDKQKERYALTLSRQYEKRFLVHNNLDPRLANPKKLVKTYETMFDILLKS